jgi:putative tributyrin esterase
MNSLRRSSGNFCGLGVLLLALTACQTERLPLDKPQVFPGVRSQDVNFYSNALQRTMPYRVFLPENVSRGTRLPVVYLLHGAFGSFRDWSNSSVVSAWASQGLILVMVEGDLSSYYMNSVERPEDRFEDYLVIDVAKDVETRFPAAQGRDNRALVGVSMGGFAALSIALRHPEMYSFVAAISPAIDILHRGFSLRRFGQWWRVRQVFGPAGDGFRQEVDPYELVNSANPARSPYFYLTAGESEPLLAPIRRFAERMGARGFDVQLKVQPGGHDWKEWDLQIPGVFKSLLDHLDEEHGVSNPAVRA